MTTEPSAASPPPAWPSPSSLGDVSKIVWQSVHRWFGWWGLAALVVLAAGVWIWWNWDKIATRPFIASLLGRWRQARLPSADGTRFTIAIARLGHDLTRDYERLIEAALSGMQGVVVLHFDRVIGLGGPKMPHEQATSAPARTWKDPARTCSSGAES